MRTLSPQLLDELRCPGVQGEVGGRSSQTPSYHPFLLRRPPLSARDPGSPIPRSTPRTREEPGTPACSTPQPLPLSGVGSEVRKPCLSLPPPGSPPSGLSPPRPNLQPGTRPRVPPGPQEVGDWQGRQLPPLLGEEGAGGGRASLGCISQHAQTVPGPQHQPLLGAGAARKDLGAGSGYSPPCNESPRARETPGRTDQAGTPRAAPSTVTAPQNLACH